MDVYSSPSRHAQVRMLHLRILIAKGLQHAETRSGGGIAAGAPCRGRQELRESIYIDVCEILSVRNFRAKRAMLTPCGYANSQPPSRRGRRPLDRAQGGVPG